VRLRHVPGRVHVNLDHIALGVREIDRQCVAVAGLPDLGDAGIADAAVRLLEPVEIGDLERQLIDGAHTLRRAPGDDNELMMVPRRCGHEGEFAAAAADAAIGDHEPNCLRIERDHPVDVAGINTTMGELRMVLGCHDFLPGIGLARFARI